MQMDRLTFSADLETGVETDGLQGDGAADGVLFGLLFESLAAAVASGDAPVAFFGGNNLFGDAAKTTHPT